MRIPTPAEMVQKVTAAMESDVEDVVMRAFAQIENGGSLYAVVSGDKKLAMEEAARRFRAIGWKCKVEPATQRDPCTLTVSAECLDCHGGGLVGYGQQERPCGCRSQDSEFPR